MINRRNDRRRRLMSEEYVSTFVEGDDSAANEAPLVPKTEPAKRAYAFGADRRSQWKTTDLFPKNLLAITLCGLVLYGIVAGLNLLNLYAPAWQPYIGDASVQAISLSGAGTLSSWMLSMMLLLTGMASLQIFALRKHRCDDYGGTYRIWLIVPPIFFFASIAAIVDFEAIIYHLASVAKLTSVTNESLIPMTIKLSLLAIVMVRMLFEIRDSKAAFSMLVIAWLAITVSTVLNTQWAENRIGTQELAIASPNAVLVATISFMLAHLSYVRFVYLHAHGAIAVKKRATTKSKAPRPTRSVAKERDAAVATETTDAPTKAQPKNRSRKKSTKTTPAVATVEPAAAQIAPKSNSNEVAPTPAAPAAQPAKKKPATMSDFQSLLKQKQAEKTTTEKAPTQNSAAEAVSTQAPITSARDEAQDESVIKMSKAERRRARKAAKAKRRAA